MKKSLIVSAYNFPEKKCTTLTTSTLISCLIFLSSEVRASGDLWDMSLDELGKIRVTSIASGTQTPLDKAAAIATVITEDDIIAMGATDIDQVLETIPGLHVTRSNQAYTAKYIIRGITSTYNPQTLMLINGIPITSLYTGNRGNAWAGMPIKSIARVDVIRGPGSALYGADAFSGVINIITKSANDIKGTKASIRAGSFNTKAVSLEHGGSYGNVDIGFTLDADSTDGWKKIVTADRQTASDTNPLNPFPPVSLAPSSVSTMKDRMDARVDIVQGNSRLRAGYSGHYNIGSGVGYYEALDPTSRITDHHYNLDYSYTLNDLTPDWGIDSRVSYYKNTQKITKSLILLPKGLAGGAFPDGLIGNPGYEEENARVDLSAVYKGLNDHIVRLGTGFTWDDMFEVTESKNFSATGAPRANGVEDVSDTPEVYLSENQRKNHYLFAQDEWKFADDWQATTGIRYDHFSDFGDTTNPRLALVWAATDKITTKLLYGKAFRAPSFAELFTVNNPVALGNPALKPETIDTYELALSHQLSSQLLYTANIYRYNIQDFITFVQTGLSATAQNVGNRQGHGLELEAEYSPTYNIRFLLNYAYQKSTDTNTQSDVGEAPNHEIYGRSEWTIASDWHVDSQITWVGAQKRAIGDNRQKLQAYTTIDMTIRKQEVISGLDVALSVHNMFNADVREPSPAGVIPNDYPMAGRSIYGELTYRF